MQHTSEPDRNELGDSDAQANPTDTTEPAPPASSGHDPTSEPESVPEEAEDSDADDRTSTPVMPAVSRRGLINFPDFSRLIQPHLDRFAKQLSDAGISSTLDLISRIAHTVDVSGLVPRPPISTTFGPAVQKLAERVQEAMPPNWPSKLDWRKAVNIIQDEGIPLVWVPRSSIVEQIVAAPDWQSRMALLLEHRLNLVADCRDVLESVSHTALIDQVPLVRRAVDAFEAGHPEAAQALAVVVTETVVSRTIEVDRKYARNHGGTYAVTAEQVLFDPHFVPFTRLRQRAALAPIAVFYTEWWPGMGTPAPDKLSRQVTVHHAQLDHYTSGNATIAILLATSVLRGVQELQEFKEAAQQDAQRNPPLRASDDDDEP